MTGKGGKGGKGGKIPSGDLKKGPQSRSARAGLQVKFLMIRSSSLWEEYTDS